MSALSGSGEATARDSPTPQGSAGDYTLAYLTAGWLAVAAGMVILALRRVRAPNVPLAPAN